MKTLIVEDDPISAKLLEKFVEKFSDVVIADNGQKTISAVKSALNTHHHFDLIFLDILLPDKNGIDLLKEIRSLESSKQRSKVIMLSSLKDLSSTEKAFQSLCDGYIVKPFEHETTVAQIRALGFNIKYSYEN